MLGCRSSNTHIEILTIKEEKKLKKGMLDRELYTQMNQINMVSCSEFEYNIKITTFLEFKTNYLKFRLFHVSRLDFCYFFSNYCTKLVLPIICISFNKYEILNMAYLMLVTQMLQDGTQ